MIRIELWKAFHQKTLYIVLGIGILLALLDSLETYRIIQEMIPLILQNKSRKVFEGIGLFGLWMSIYGGNLGAYVFRIVWPVLAAVPFGWSYWKERKDGSYYLAVEFSYFHQGSGATNTLIYSLPLLREVWRDSEFLKNDPEKDFDQYRFEIEGEWFNIYEYEWISGHMYPHVIAKMQISSVLK